MSEGRGARGAAPPPFFKRIGDGGAGGTLALVFSHVHEPAGRFTFERTLARLGLDALLLNASDKTYYARGIPGLGDDVPSTAAALRSAIAARAPDRVVAIGLSMGGFGALLYGALLGVDRVVALGGETMLELPRSRSRAFIAGRFRPSHADIRPLARTAPKTRFDLVFGENDLIDVYSAWRLHDLPNVATYPVRRAPHEIARWLQQRGTLADFLRAAALGDPLAGYLDLGTSMLSPTAVPDLYAAQAALWEDEPEAALIRARPAALALPELPLAQFYLGRALERTGQPAEAIDAFRRALALDPDRPAIRLGLARALIRTGQIGEAEGLVADLLSEQPRNAQGYHLQGLVLAQRGASEAAMLAQREAAALDPANASFPLELGRLYLQARRYEDAILALREASRLSPRQPFPHFLLGRAEAARGRIEDAAAAYARAVALRPENAAYRQALAALTLTRAAA